MIQPKKQRRSLFALCAAVLFITLFFGLKPKGFRFINQVRWVENNSSIAFTNIGMVYGKKTLGEIGISDSMSIVLAIKPYRTGRRLSRIVTIVGKDGRELFAVDQWMKGIEITLWDGKGRRVRKAGVGEALSAELFRLPAIGINDHEMRLIVADSAGSNACCTIQLPPGFLKNGRIILGLSSTGRSPWRGEIAELALFKRFLTDEAIASFMKNWREAGSFKPLSDEKPEALFSFDGPAGKTVADRSGNGWNLTVPHFPKMFRYEVLTLLPDLQKIDKSLVSDTLVNFLGFFPLGGCFCLLLLSAVRFRKHAIVLTIAAALCVSLGIELWQVFIPTRASQLIDVILNSAGAGMGAVAVRTGLRIFRQPEMNDAFSS